MCKVTIGIVVYNIEDYVGESVLSALNQDFEDLEILVCDDCSTDNSIKIVRDIINKHPNGNKARIIINPVNYGTASVRNLCIDNAKGAFLFFLDGDDYLEQDCISVLYNKMQEDPADIVMANYRVVDDSDVKKKQRIQSNIVIPNSRTDGNMAIAKWMEAHKKYYHGNLWNKLYRLSFLKDNNIRCRQSHGTIEDIYFTFLTLLKAKSFVSIERITYCWRYRPMSSVNGVFTEGKLDIYLQIFDDMRDDIIEHESASPNLEIPKQVLLYIYRRYNTGYVLRKMMASKEISPSYKKAYLDHIYNQVGFGFDRNLINSGMGRVLFDLWRSKHRYMLINCFFLSRPLLRVLYIIRKRIRSFFPFLIDV